MTDQLEIAQTQYQVGKDAFERGEYRRAIQCLEKAVNLLERGTALSGEAQIWLVTAYEAAGQRQEAIALCEQVSKHPDPTIRKQGSRLLYILQAPRLKTRPEWLTTIPDLTNLDKSESNLKGAYEQASANRPARRPRPRPEPEPEPMDLSQVNTQENGFIWVALGAIALAIGYFIWLA